MACPEGHCRQVLYMENGQLVEGRCVTCGAVLRKISGEWHEMPREEEFVEPDLKPRRRRRRKL